MHVAAKTVEQLPEVRGAEPRVDAGVVEERPAVADAQHRSRERLRGSRHELHEPERSRSRPRGGIEGALLTNETAEKRWIDPELARALRKEVPVLDRIVQPAP